MKALKDILTFIFGKSPKQRFRRICVFLAIVIIGINLILNIGYDKEHGISWRPAANININKELK